MSVRRWQSEASLDDRVHSMYIRTGQEWWEAEVGKIEALSLKHSAPEQMDADRWLIVLDYYPTVPA